MPPRNYYFNFLHFWVDLIFPRRRVPTRKWWECNICGQVFVERCMKIKEIGPRAWSSGVTLGFITRGDQRGGSQVNWKNRKMIISLPLRSQPFLKYANMVDILIHQFTCIEFSDGTLPILLNFS